MSHERFSELVPLAAIDVLDGEDRAGFEVHERHCAACRDELAGFREAAALLPLLWSPVAPRPAVRQRVLQAIAVRPLRRARPRARSGWLALAAAAGFATASIVLWQQRDAACELARTATARVSRLEAELSGERERSQELTRRLAETGGLMARAESRLTSLSGLPPAPAAHARIVFDPRSGEAVLLVSGLAPAPSGKGYQVWVIAEASPVPAGVFQVDAQGRAVFRLPVVPETAQVRTFAVTLELAAGVPAPSGPMVLAGAVS
jgi:anti-sigma-K factor RskA